ncbi:MAG: hypothetical protein HY343_04975 [Lentisphaerae bacterium]|nr:hypothetical protein [Lentisphaerota bacterium]
MNAEPGAVGLPLKKESSLLYLCSALLMLLGCYLVELALKPNPGNLGKMLVIMGVLNVYEFCLIGIGLWLVRGRRILPAGRLLLLLAIVFLVDSTFFNTACIAADPSVGGLLGTGVLSLAAIKVGLMAYCLRIRFSATDFALSAATLLVLLGMPGVFEWLLVNRCAPDGKIPEMAIAVGWWVCGLLLASFPPRLNDARLSDINRSNGVAETVRDALIVVPFLSVVVHLLLGNAQYQRPFHVCFIAPVLFGTSAYLARIAHARGGKLKAELVGLVALGVVFSIYSPETLVAQWWGFGISPFRLALIAAALDCVLFLVLFRAWVFAAIAALGFLVAATGHTVEASWDTAIRVLKGVARFLPKTLFHWGILAMAAAFILLALGVVTTLRRSNGGKPDASPK